MENRKCIVGVITFSMIFVCLVLCLLNCYSEENDNEAHRKRFMERTKKAYEYDKWAGIVEFSDKEVNNLGIGEEFFERFSEEIKIYTSVKNRERNYTARLESKKNDIAVRVSILCKDSPTAAKKIILDFMYATSTFEALKRYDPNDPNLFFLKGPNEPNLPKIGDVCFYGITAWPPQTWEKQILQTLMFTRNNVFVILRLWWLGDEKLEEWPNLLEVAHLIDERLKASLVPMNKQ